LHQSVYKSKIEADLLQAYINYYKCTAHHKPWPELSEDFTLGL